MKATLIILSLSCLTACATTTPATKSHSSEFGKAVRHNIAAHAIAPTDKQKADTYIPADAAKRAKARENYRNGSTPEPEPITTMN